jgi:hypothetical protein
MPSHIRQEDFLKEYGVLGTKQPTEQRNRAYEVYGLLAATHSMYVDFLPAPLILRLLRRIRFFFH